MHASASTADMYVRAYVYTPVSPFVSSQRTIARKDIAWRALSILRRILMRERVRVRNSKRDTLLSVFCLCAACRFYALSRLPGRQPAGCRFPFKNDASCATVAKCRGKRCRKIAGRKSSDAPRNFAIRYPCRSRETRAKFQWWISKNGDLADSKDIETARVWPDFLARLDFIVLNEQKLFISAAIAIVVYTLKHVSPKIGGAYWNKNFT